MATIKFRKITIVRDGWDLYYRRDYVGALSSCEAQLEAARSTGNPAAQDCRGWALLALGEPQNAANAFREALEIDPEFFYSESGLIAAKRSGLVKYNEGWSLSSLGRYEEAEARFEEARVGLDPDLLWLIEDGLAWILYYRGEFEGAKQAFRNIVDGNPKAYLSLTGLGFIAVQQDDFSEAVKQLSASFTVAPNQDLTSFTTPAVKMLDAGKFEEAGTILGFGNQTFPLSADIKYLLARSEKGLGNEDTASANAIAAAALSPTYIDSTFDDLDLPQSKVRDGYLSLAWGLYFAGQNERALKRFEQYIDNGGGDPNAVRGLSFALFRLGNYEVALIELRKIMIHEETLRLLPVTEYIPIPGTSSNWTITYSAKSTLGWIYLRIGDAEDAEKTFREVLKIYPFWIDALTGLAYSLAAQDRTEEAQNTFEEALKISPGYPDALQGLNSL